MNEQPRFPIGTQYSSRGKHPRICTVVDYHRTYNTAGELVKCRYVASHFLMGRQVFDYDVVEVTVAMGVAALEGAEK